MIDHTEQPAPPKHLSDEAKAWWRELIADYAFEPHSLRVLQCAAESWDRMVMARDLIADEGMVQVDRFGQKKPHPAVSIERDSRAAFVRYVRELGLDGSEPDAPRPPRISGRYDGS